MKSFWGSVILFAAIILAVVINGIYIIYVSESLLGYANKLKEEKDPAALLEELQDFWDYNRTFLSLSIDTTTIDEVEKIILSLSASHQMGERYEFEKYRVHLVESAEEISRLERLRFENIF